MGRRPAGDDPHARRGRRQADRRPDARRRGATRSSACAASGCRCADRTCSGCSCGRWRARRRTAPIEDHAADGDRAGRTRRPRARLLDEALAELAAAGMRAPPSAARHHGRGAGGGARRRALRRRLLLDRQSTISTQYVTAGGRDVGAVAISPIPRNPAVLRLIARWRRMAARAAARSACAATRPAIRAMSRPLLDAGLRISRWRRPRSARAKAAIAAHRPGPWHERRCRAATQGRATRRRLQGDPAGGAGAPAFRHAPAARQGARQEPQLRHRRSPIRPIRCRSRRRISRVDLRGLPFLAGRASRVSRSLCARPIRGRLGRLAAAARGTARCITLAAPDLGDDAATANPAAGAGLRDEPARNSRALLRRSRSPRREDSHEETHQRGRHDPGRKPRRLRGGARRHRDAWARSASSSAARR